MSSKLNGETNSGVTHMRDVDSLEVLKSGAIEWSRGETPEDIRQQCLQLCQRYIGGDWLEQTLDSIRVRRLSGGISNQMYYCGIGRPEPTSAVPQEVAIRFYGKIFVDGSANRDNTPDMIVSLMASVRGLGPQVYGLFEGGQIQKYYKHRHFLVEDHANHRVVRQVLATLAKWHSLEVPVKRNLQWFEFAISIYDEMSKRFDIRREFEEYNCRTLLDNDVMTEFEFTRTQVERCGSPVVFGHNDYHSKNIMITEPDDKVIICDFEVSGYAYRGYDLGVLLFYPMIWDTKGMASDSKGLIDDRVLRQLIQIYVKESERINGKEWTQNSINSLEHIINETKVFLLFYSLFICLFMLSNGHNLGFGRKLIMAIVENVFKHYLANKQHFTEQGVFANLSE